MDGIPGSRFCLKLWSSGMYGRSITVWGVPERRGKSLKGFHLFRMLLWYASNGTSHACQHFLGIRKGPKDDNPPKSPQLVKAFEDGDPFKGVTKEKGS